MRAGDAYMELWKILGSLLTRKAVGPPLILLSLLVAVGTFFFVPARYQSSALMVLTTSARGATIDPSKTFGLQNPLLGFSDGLKTTATILIQAINTPELRHDVGAPKDGPVELTVDDGRTDPDLLDISGPYIYVSVVAPTADEASKTVAAVQARVRRELNDRQVALGAPKSTFVSLNDVVPLSQPERVTSVQWKAAGSAFAVSLLVCFGIAYAVARRKRIRRIEPDDGRFERMSGWSEDPEVLGAATVQWRIPASTQDRPRIGSPVAPPGTTVADASSSALSTQNDPRPVVDDPPPANGTSVTDADDESDQTVVIIMDPMLTADSAVGGRPSENGSSGRPPGKRGG
ncbi:hypothetical protein [Microbispora sp. GKU 823]|uniref:hypothetical protein n=1 Tax=Microbispora sp. GKU 823 TaxID=1652100 RepID=UPI00117DE46A|nr:hypothetical protein [Microbispora sp. GKU 823]